MHIALVALNAQYMHTNLAVRSISAYLHKHSSFTPQIVELTINQQPDAILQTLYRAKADVYLFSCYLWNLRLICETAQELHKLLPNAVLAVGGPQVTYDTAAFLQQNPCFTAVIAGEGEHATLQLVQALKNGTPLANCPGLWYQSENEILQTPAAAPLSLDTLPFAYTDLPAVQRRILYYESMRGCPFGCSYCLSSVEKGVRLKSAALACKELQLFLNAGVRQVKFVDRTFNCNHAHALHIWSYLAAHDNGKTNFHFELSGELLDDSLIAFLSTIRPGLFQFEIGVQSTNTNTLREIQRPANLPLLFSNIQKLRAANNIHLHLDLIAGLPHEDYASFVSSFNAVYALHPQQFQLGILKVLNGSGMQASAEKYGLVSNNEPPFEVLFTQWLTYEQLLQLKSIAAMVELYHNSGRFSSLINYLLPHFQSPFALYSALGALYEEKGYQTAPASKTAQYELLADCMGAHNIECDATPQWLCRYDIARSEKIKTLPRWVTVDGSRPHRQRVLTFYNQPGILQKHLPHLAEREAKQVLKIAHIEVFPFDPETGQQGECAILFDYSHRDITGRARQWRVSLPATGSSMP